MVGGIFPQSLLVAHLRSVIDYIVVTGLAAYGTRRVFLDRTKVVPSGPVYRHAKHLCVRVDQPCKKLVSVLLSCRQALN